MYLVLHICFNSRCGRVRIFTWRRTKREAESFSAIAPRQRWAVRTASPETHESQARRRRVCCSCGVFTVHSSSPPRQSLGHWSISVYKWEVPVLQPRSFLLCLNQARGRSHDLSSRGCSWCRGGIPTDYYMAPGKGNSVFMWLVPNDSQNSYLGTHFLNMLCYFIFVCVHEYVFVCAHSCMYVCSVVCRGWSPMLSVFLIESAAHWCS